MRIHSQSETCCVHGERVQTLPTRGGEGEPGLGSSLSEFRKSPAERYSGARESLGLCRDREEDDKPLTQELEAG